MKELNRLSSQLSSLLRCRIRNSRSQILQLTEAHINIVWAQRYSLIEGSRFHQIMRMIQSHWNPFWKQLLTLGAVTTIKRVQLTLVKIRLETKTFHPNFRGNQAFHTTHSLHWEKLQMMKPILLLKDRTPLRRPCAFSCRLRALSPIRPSSLWEESPTPRIETWAAVKNLKREPITLSKETSNKTTIASERSTNSMSQLLSPIWLIWGIPSM